MKNELGQSVDHFKRAATIAAQETSSTVGPKLNAAKDRVQPAATKAKDVASTGWGTAVSTLTPLVAAATEQVRHSSEVTRKQSRKAVKQGKKNSRKLEKRANKALGRKPAGRSKGKIFGYALIGTAVGIGAAWAVKRRKAAQWDEYDPAAPISSGVEDAAFEPTPPSPNGTSPDAAQHTTR